MEPRTKTGMLIKDRPELATKPKPLTVAPDASVAEAVAEMCRRDYGSVIVVDEERRPLGISTERDVMKKIVDPGRDPAGTRVCEVMTAEIRVARDTDEVLDWLRIMSNERFRRLPVVDAEGRIEAVMTQGDFVSYTWPELLHQGRQLLTATLGRNFYVSLILGALVLYGVLVILVVD